MTPEQLETWVRYLDAAHMVAWDEVRAFDQVHLARKYCQCLRVGVLNEDDVTDLAIWNALGRVRQQDKDTSSPLTPA